MTRLSRSHRRPRLPLRQISSLNSRQHRDSVAWSRKWSAAIGVQSVETAGPRLLHIRACGRLSGTRSRLEPHCRYLGLAFRGRKVPASAETAAVVASLHSLRLSPFTPGYGKTPRMRPAESVGQRTPHADDRGTHYAIPTAAVQGPGQASTRHYFSRRPAASALCILPMASCLRCLVVFFHHPSTANRFPVAYFASFHFWQPCSTML